MTLKAHFIVASSPSSSGESFEIHEGMNVEVEYSRATNWAKYN